MYKINFRKIISVIIFTALFLAANLVQSANKDMIDVVLVMDSSGSMKKTDPQSLRIPAAKLFISLLKDGDRAGVISFSGEGDTLIDLTQVDSRNNKEKLFAAAEKITSRGKYTNLYGALTKGMEVLAEDFSEGRTQIIILMSDGMMDVGDPLEDSRLVERIRTELSVTLEESGIKVYTIAFTENSDRILLERISKRTGGFYNLTLFDQDFHVVFTSIFESLKSPEMLPMSQNGFKVDNSVEEVTIVATKGSSDTKIMLNAPDRQSFTSDNKNDGIEWFPSNKFDMITVKNPTDGRWEILFSTGENNKAYIITDLQLKTNFEKLYSTYGEPRDVQIWLEKEGNILNEKDVLDKIEFLMVLTAPDGRTTKLKPFSKGDGTYVRSIAPFSPGNYTLRVIAQGKTFERAKDFVFNVADVQESKEDVKHDRVKKQKQEELLNKKLEEQAAKEQAALNAALQKEKDEEVSWGKVIGYFIGVNLILGLGILAFFKIRKSKKFMPLKFKKKTEVIEQETEETIEKPEAPESNVKEKEEAAPAPEVEDAAEKQEDSAPATEEELSQQSIEPESNDQESAVQPEDEPAKSSDQEISLEDTELDTSSIEEPAAPKEKAEVQAANQEIALEDASLQDVKDKGADIVSDQETSENDQVDIDSLMSQDDLDSLLASAPERDPAPEEDPEPEGIKEEVDIQDIMSDAIQGTTEDDIKEGANEEVAEAKESAEEEKVDNNQEEQKAVEVEAQEEKAPEVQTATTEVKKEPEQKVKAETEKYPPEAQAAAVEEPASEEAKETENVDDMWAEAFKEAEAGQGEEQKAVEAEAQEEKTPEIQTAATEEKKAPEQKVKAEAEKYPPEAQAAAVEEPESEEAKETENIDDMWAEAFKEAEETSEKDVSVPKPDNAQSTDGAEEAPVDN